MPSKIEDTRMVASPETPRNALHATLLERIRSGQVCVGIIGLGYVGLPLAHAFATKKIAVLGFDVDTAKVEQLGAAPATSATSAMRRSARCNRTSRPRTGSSASMSRTPSSSACPRR